VRELPPGLRARTNRELCLEMIDAYRPGHLGRLLELLDPGVVWSTTERWVDRETWHGHNEVRAGLERFFAEWCDVWHELEQFREAGNRFAVITRMRGTHRHTGIETEMLTAGVCDVRNGLAVRIVGYSDPEAAMRALES
jgi:ketosteroid isomerase-like protein